MTNSTVSGHPGVGIVADSRVRVAFSTFSNNAHGPIASTWLGFVVEHSIVDGVCVDGEWSSGGNNIESPGDACGFDQPSDQVGVSAEDLRRSPLGHHGGPTRTHGLYEGSVAIDRVVLEECVKLDCVPHSIGCDDPHSVALTTDQRGFPRDTMCDVGALEVQP